MRLVAVGRIGAGPEGALFTRYAERLRPALTVTELVDGRGSPAEVKRREAEAILAAAHGWVVALDLGAPPLPTEAFGARLTAWRDAGRVPCFIIGGAEGLGAAVMARADATLSLGPMTWPHLLARVLLAEQLYRCQCIAAGHPYHRAGRP